MRAVVPWTARQFARAIVMPNLAPPVTTSALAAEYRERIRAAVPDGVAFEPLMTAYLTDTTDPADIARFPEIKLVTIQQAFGSWEKAQQEHFADGGVFDQIQANK